MNQERKGYRFNGRLYHPECMPENKSISTMFIKPIFNKYDLWPYERARCVKCGLSLFIKSKGVH